MIRFPCLASPLPVADPWLDTENRLDYMMRDLRDTLKKQLDACQVEEDKDRALLELQMFIDDLSNKTESSQKNPSSSGHASNSTVLPRAPALPAAEKPSTARARKRKAMILARRQRRQAVRDSRTEEILPQIANNKSIQDLRDICIRARERSIRILQTTTTLEECMKTLSELGARDLLTSVNRRFCQMQLCVLFEEFKTRHDEQRARFVGTPEAIGVTAMILDEVHKGLLDRAPKEYAKEKLKLENNKQRGHHWKKLADAFGIGFVAVVPSAYLQLRKPQQNELIGELQLQDGEYFRTLGEKLQDLPEVLSGRAQAGSYKFESVEPEIIEKSGENRMELLDWCTMELVTPTTTGPWTQPQMHNSGGLRHLPTPWSPFHSPIGTM